MAALDTLNIPEAPVSEGAIQTTAPKSTGITGKIALDPTQTESILANMQRYIDERQNPMSQLMGGINKARAGLAGPSALTAYQQQENLQDKQLMDYRTQMAAYRAAQAQATNEANAYYGTNAPAAGGTAGAAPAAGAVPAAGGVTFPPEVQRQLDQLPKNDIAGRKAIEKKYLDTVVTERIKRENSPELDKLVPYAINGKEELITLRDAAELAKKNPNLPRNQQILIEANKAAPAGNDGLAKLKNAVFATESTSGKADTTKPGIQGAMGPMQITPETWETNVKRGIIPKDYDINNPVQNKEAGNRLLDYYYKQYNGDIDKTLAAYHGGEGAINADGTINLERKDKLGTSIGDYITKNKAAMGLTSDPAVTATTSKPELTLAEIQAQRKIVEEANVAEQRKTAEDIAAQRASTIEAGSSAQERLGSINYLKGLLNNKETARAFGVINEPGVINAILGAAEEGANLGNLGNAGIAGMSDAVRKAMPNATQTEIDAAQKATREFALMQLSAAKIYLKGQGAVSDAERKLIRELAGSVKNSPGALRDFLKWSETRADFDDKVGSAYRNFNKNNRNVSFERFLESNEYSTLKSQYVSELKKFGASTAPSSTSKTAHPGLSLVDKYAPKKAQ
jgi:hypothetical protein